MPGRNEPCPCGSGRKYKHCCLKATDAADFRWRQVRAAESRLVADLFAQSLKEFGPEFLRAAVEEFFLWTGIPENFEQTDDFVLFFIPWFVYEYVADPHDPDRVANAPEESLAALHLRRHFAQLSPVERAFLESACASPLSFYAVTGTVPGSGVALRDVLTGEEVVVRDRLASDNVSAGALLFTRVVTVEDTSIMSGNAPLEIPPQWHLPLLDFRKRCAKGRNRTLTREAVSDLSIELRELYFRIEEELWNPKLPEIRNTDGDRLVMTVLTYRLACSPATAFDRLKSLSRLPAAEVDGLLSQAARDESGAVTAVTVPWSRKGARESVEGGTTTLGMLQIEGDRLQVEVNSSRRAGRIQREIAKRLGADAELETRTAEPIEKLLAERRDSPRDALDDLEQERLQQQPEVQELLSQQRDRYWESWLDTPIPALDDRTPRQAARTAAGRERLDALFAEFAWRDGRSDNPMSPDVPALRAKLGLR